MTASSLLLRVSATCMALAWFTAGCASKHNGPQPDNRQPIVAAESNGKYFVFIYRPGPNWKEGKSVRMQPVIPHAMYMNKLERDGVLLLGGPFKDDSGAFGILLRENLEEAKKVVEADPAIRDGIMTAEVHPWFSAAPGCLENKPW